MYGLCAVEAGRLLPHMLQFTEEHRKEGHLLQEEITNFQEELRLSLDEIWTKEAESESSDLAKPPDSTKKILKPDIIEPQWRVKLWEVKESHFKQ
jgi:elongator complex protein 1